MSCTPNILVSPLPAGSCLPSELYDYLTTALQLVVTGCSGCICTVTQSTPPGPEQLDYIWNRISETGVPLYDNIFYNGEWRRKPTTPIGAELFYTGDPATQFNAVTRFGIHGGQWDGWQIIIDDAGRFPVIASTYSTSGLGWIINYQGVDGHTGGQQSVVLDITNTYRPPVNAVTATLWEADGNSPGGDSALWGIYNTHGSQVPIIPADPGNTTPTPVPIFPSFVAKALVKYIGLEGS